MRHRKQHRKLGRTSEHRLALRRNLAQSLFEHGQITTSLPKAKDVRPFVERLITLARKAGEGSLPARQRLIRIMGDRSMIPADRQEDYNQMSDTARHKTLRARSGRRHRTGQAKAGMDFTGEGVVHHLIQSVAPQYADRPGGYTRIIKLPRRRIGDNTVRAILQLVGKEQDPGAVAKPKKSARAKRIGHRYAAAARAGQDPAGRGAKQSTPRSEPDTSSAPDDDARTAEPDAGDQTE